MKIWKNHREEPYYTFVKNGMKTVEGRLVKGKYAQIMPGDTIEVQKVDESDSFIVEVLDRRTYKSFFEMLENEGIDKVLPDIKNIEKGVEVYRKFYSKDDEEKYGVVAIEVKTK